jgi:hypothetical protein
LLSRDDPARARSCADADLVGVNERRARAAVFRAGFVCLPDGVRRGAALFAFAAAPTVFVFALVAAFRVSFSFLAAFLIALARALGGALRPVFRAGPLGTFLATFLVTRLATFFAAFFLDVAAAFFFVFARFMFPPFQRPPRRILNRASCQTSAAAPSHDITLGAFSGMYRNLGFAGENKRIIIEVIACFRSGQ